MTFGNFVVRVAPSANKAKWKVEIHKSARAALTAARKHIAATPWNKEPPQVCVFDMKKWSAKPVCLERAGWDARRSSGTRPQRKYARARYVYAPSKTPEYRPGGKLKRFVKRNGIVDVVLDGYSKRRRKGRR